MAKRSEVSVDQWLRQAVMAACSIDEAHWQEMEQRDRIAKDIDRTQFGRLSRHLRNLPESTNNVLVDAMVIEHQKGCVEGSASAMRLASVRLARGAK